MKTKKLSGFRSKWVPKSSEILQLESKFKAQRGCSNYGVQEPNDGGGRNLGGWGCCHGCWPLSLHAPGVTVASQRSGGLSVGAGGAVTRGLITEMLYELSARFAFCLLGIWLLFTIGTEGQHSDPGRHVSAQQRQESASLHREAPAEPARAHKPQDLRSIQYVTGTFAIVGCTASFSCG